MPRFTALATIGSIAITVGCQQPTNNTAEASSEDQHTTRSTLQVSLSVDPGYLTDGTINIHRDYNSVPYTLTVKSTGGTSISGRCSIRCEYTTSIGTQYQDLGSCGMFNTDFFINNSWDTTGSTNISRACTRKGQLYAAVTDNSYPFITLATSNRIPYQWSVP